MTLSPDHGCRSTVDLDLSLDVVIFAFKHVETLVRQRPTSQQSLDVVHHHLSGVKTIQKDDHVCVQASVKTYGLAKAPGYALAFGAKGGRHGSLDEAGQNPKALKAIQPNKTKHLSERCP